MISRRVGERGWEWQVKARRGVGQSRLGRHHHLSPPPFLSSFSSWQGEWHSQPLSLKKPFLSSQSLPVLTEWRSEGKKRGRKEPTRAFFSVVLSISVGCSERGPVSSSWAGLDCCWPRTEIWLWEKRWEKLLRRCSTLFLTSRRSKELKLQAGRSRGLADGGMSSLHLDLF